MSVEDIANEIRRHNKLYDEGRPEITDTEYDSLVGLMKYIDPDNEVLKEVGAPVSYGKKVKHDIPMGSLEKIKCQVDKNGNPVFIPFTNPTETVTIIGTSTTVISESIS